jgi:hypothetical protein
MVGGFIDGTMVYRLVLIIEARNQPYLYNFVVNILLHLKIPLLILNLLGT